MAKNTGKDYEDLVEEVFRRLLEQDAVSTLKLARNTTIQGKSTHHEIDIYWSFEVGGIKYETIVQAKDEAKKISQGKMLQFREILNDLPNQPRGIFVTRTGYQPGAIQVAKHHGIAVYELRKPTDEDLDGRIKEIHITGHFLIPDYQVEALEFDTSWVKQRIQAMGKDLPQEMELSVEGQPNELIITDQNGSRISTLHDLIEGYRQSGFEAMPETTINHHFTIPSFIETTHPDFPVAKLTTAIFSLSTAKTTTEFNISVTDLVSFILKETITNQRHFISKDKRILKPE